MALVVMVSDLLKQLLQPRRFPPDVTVVSLHDVIGNRAQFGFPPAVQVLRRRSLWSGLQPLDERGQHAFHLDGACRINPCAARWQTRCFFTVPRKSAPLKSQREGPATRT